MERQRALQPRHIEVLHALVRTYIETGEPVPSRAISRGRPDGLSAASIRNIMADLSDEGYLAQPHTSAGRIPTEKAFRSYVTSLAAARTTEGELERLRLELRKSDTFEDRVERTSHIVTEMTRSFGIVAAIPAAGQALDHVELLGLGDRRVVMVVATRDRIVRNRLVTLVEEISQDELNSIRNYVNRNFSGWTLSELRRELERRLERESTACDLLLKRLAMFYEKGLLEIGLSPEVHTGGAANLVGIDLHLTRERMRELFRALDEKKRILELLDRFLEQTPNRLNVQIGLAEIHPSMSELSLIGVTVACDTGLETKIAVIGPVRMNYGKAMAAVWQVGQAFQSLPV